MTGFGRFSVNDARKFFIKFSVAPFIYSLTLAFVRVLICLVKNTTLFLLKVLNTNDLNFDLL